MADLTDVEIARVGTWSLASGELEVTEPMLRDAAAYGSRPDARPAPVKLGHEDPRFDGEPALGWLANLRVEGSGDDAVLKGDVTGMPDWLAQTAASAWPDRSMEGWTDYEVEDRTYGLVVDGLALLGVTPPGMSTIRSLRDLPQALGVAASGRVAAATFLRAAVSNRPWSDFTQADYTDEQWQRACVLHRAGAEGKQAHSLPIREPDGDLNRNGVHAAASRFNQVQAPGDAKRSAANALIRAYGELDEEPPEVLRRAAASQSPTSAAEAAARIHNAPIRGPQRGATVDFTTEQESTLRAALGIPDGDPLEPDKVLATIDDLAKAKQEPPKEPEPKPAEPVAATPHKDGTLVVDASAWDEQQKRIKRLEADAERRARDERDKIIAEAIQDGKFLPNRREHWVRLWDADPKGTREVLAGLHKNVIPVEAMGHGIDAEDADIDAEYAHLFPPVHEKKGA